jgi:hypothetical protein
MSGRYTQRHARRLFDVRINGLVRDVGQLTEVGTALERLLWRLLVIVVVGTVILAVLTGRVPTAFTGLLLLLMRRSR